MDCWQNSSTIFDVPSFWMTQIGNFRIRASWTLLISLVLLRPYIGYQSLGLEVFESKLSFAIALWSSKYFRGTCFLKTDPLGHFEWPALHWACIGLTFIDGSERVPRLVFLIKLTQLIFCHHHPLNQPHPPMPDSLPPLPDTHPCMSGTHVSHMVPCQAPTVGQGILQVILLDLYWGRSRDFYWANYGIKTVQIEIKCDGNLEKGQIQQQASWNGYF